MASATKTRSTRSKPGEPTWEIAMMYPRQGEWTEEEYLALDAAGNRLIEFSDGYLEFLPMPLPYHQLILSFLYKALDAFVSRHKLGTVLFAPLPVRLWPGKYREPDLVFLKKGRSWGPRRTPDGADLAIEIVSEGEEDRERDFEIKRKEYAKAGIAEYWIVDPRQECILILSLLRRSYKEVGRFGLNDRARSLLLPGFEVSVREVFAAGKQA